MAAIGEINTLVQDHDRRPHRHPKEQAKPPSLFKYAMERLMKLPLNEILEHPRQELAQGPGTPKPERA